MQRRDTTDGDLEEQLASLEQRVAAEPESFAAWFDLGRLLGRRYRADIDGQIVTGVYCYERALELKADVSRAWNNLGVALIGEQIATVGGAEFNSVQCARRALELSNFLDSVAWCNLGSFLLPHKRCSLQIPCTPRTAVLLSAFSNQESGGSNEVVEVSVDSLVCAACAVRLKPSVSNTWEALGRCHLMKQRKRLEKQQEERDVVNLPVITLPILIPGYPPVSTAACAYAVAAAKEPTYRKVWYGLANALREADRDDPSSISRDASARSRAILSAVDVFGTSFTANLCSLRYEVISLPQSSSQPHRSLQRRFPHHHMAEMETIFVDKRVFKEMPNGFVQPSHAIRKEGMVVDWIPSLLPEVELTNFVP